MADEKQVVQSTFHGLSKVATDKLIELLNSHDENIALKACEVILNRSANVRDAK